MAKVSGREWTVRSVDDNVVIKAGSLATVKRIEGVKLILETEKELAKTN